MNLSSGVDHEKVSAANPHWSVNDWCWYWHRDLEKALAKAKLPYGHEGWDANLMTDCGEGCVCREKLKCRT